METKKFISGLGQSKEITAFLQNDNLVDFALINAKKDPNGNISFQTITDFHKIESHDLDTDGQRAFELFQAFKSSKNAIACILKAIETKKPINDDTFNNQSKITPANYDAEIKALNSFGTFWSWASDKIKKATAEIALNWMEGAGIVDTMFDFYFINGENNLTLKKKQIIRLYDPIYGQKIYSMVFMASPNGIVTCIDDNSVFSLSAESAKTIELIGVNSAPEEVLKFFNEQYDAYVEETEERKTARLERAVKLHNAKAEAEKKAEALEEKRATSRKALEEKAKKSTEEKAKIEKLSMTTKEEIEKVVAMISKKEEVLTPAHRRDLLESVKKSRASLKTASTATARPARKTKTEETPDINKINAEALAILATEGNAPAKNIPSAKPTRQRRATAPEKPMTIDAIIEEDAKSENPILA